MTELQEYNFQFIHKPSSSQNKIDVLSYKLDHTQDKDDNKDQTLLKGEQFRNIITQKNKFWKEVEKAKGFMKEEVQRAVEQEKEDQRQKRKVLFQKEKIYVSNSATLQEEIITKHHDSKLASHLGYTKIYKLITRNYQWPRILEDIK